MTLTPLEDVRNKWHMDRVYTFDIEAYGWTNPIALGMGNNKRGEYKKFTGEDCISKFVDELLRRKYRNCRFVAHNGGKFDFIPVIEELAKRRMVNDIDIHILTKGSNNTPFFVRIGDKNNKPRYLQDSLALMPRSLDSLTESFTPDMKKGDFDFKDLDKWGQIDEHKQGELLEYLKRDVKSLYKVLQEFTDILLELTNNKCPPQLTVGSTAMSAYRSHFMPKGTIIEDCYKPNKEPNPEQMFRNSYFGGRTEVYKKYGENLKHYDVNSLYPYCYTKKKIPVGKVSHTGEHFPIEETDIGGVIKIQGKVPEKCCNGIPVLPTRYKPKESQAEKVIFPTGKIEGWYMAKEVRYALEVGALEDIKILDSYATEYGKPFKSYGKNLYKLKKDIDKDKKPGKYKVVKFLLNSFYGKFGMEREHKSIVMGEVTKEFQEGKEMINPKLADKGIMLEKEESKAGYILPRIASAITAQARIEMHKWFMRIFNKGGDIWYCDTDSIVTNISLPTGEELGEMDLEGELKEGLFLAPKIYAERYDNDDELVKAKGMKDPDLSFESFKESWNNDNPGKIQSEWEGPKGFKMGMKQSEESWFEKENYSRSLREFDNKRNWVDEINSEPLEI